jgi:uncharacterized ferritin-like protein (DUF455 family)
MPSDNPTELRQAALHWLAESDPSAKAAGVAGLAQQHQAGAVTLNIAANLHVQGSIPGRPAKPDLVEPALLQRRSMASTQGRATLIHALAHIEFNAINLALDAVWRFRGMPEQYYVDWMHVAAEEARHYTLLVRHLANLGYAYGDFPAHNGLWDMAERTREDVLARIALIPRTVEARGLDVSPGIRDKLAQAGDLDAAAILDVILEDEIGHVRIGNHWYLWLCAQRGLNAADTDERLMRKYQAPAMRGPFNLQARRAAGFTEDEIANLTRNTAKG